MRLSTVFYFRLVFVLAVLSSCQYKYKDFPDSDKNFYGKISNEEKVTMMNFSFINDNIIKPKCVSCHGIAGGINLESYSNVILNLDKINDSIFIKTTMPKDGILTSEEKRLLWNWIDLGAPFESDRTHAPTEPLVATYKSIEKNILSVRCYVCHNATGSGKRVPLDEQSLLNSPLDLVLPGNPDESGLILSIERDDDKRMPPEDKGYSALKPEEIKVMREWISSL